MFGKLQTPGHRRSPGYGGSFTVRDPALHTRPAFREDSTMREGTVLPRDLCRPTPMRVGPDVRGAILLVLLSFVSAAWGQGTPRDVSGVVVQFSDGSQQTFDRQVGNPPTTAPAGKTKSALGVNLEQLRDWSRSFVYIDAMKTSRKFASAKQPWSGTVPLDADGWPTT